MAKERQFKKLLPAPSSPPPYEVGYRQPPKATRFKPGQTGNPRGRPKGSKRPPPRPYEERMKALVMDEAYRTIMVRDGERTVGVPMIQAILRSLALSAAKGHQRSQRLFTDLLRLVEQEKRALHDLWLETAIEYKCDWERELERRERLGITAPPPIPHPDDIIVNLRTGTVEIRGPMSKEEQPVWDKFRKRKKDCDLEIAELRELLRQEPGNQIILSEIGHEQRIREIISKVIPD